LNTLFMGVKGLNVEHHRQIRIEWSISNFGKRYGTWRADSKSARSALQTWIDYQNKKYGVGTHWLGEKVIKDNDATTTSSPDLSPEDLHTA